jgi:hypothetical protein
MVCYREEAQNGAHLLNRGGTRLSRPEVRRYNRLKKGSTLHQRKCEKPMAHIVSVAMVRIIDGWERLDGPQFISDLENGKKEICLRNLDVLATTFGTTISKLLREHGPRHHRPYPTFFLIGPEPA